MNKNTWVDIPNIDMDCFGCGLKNPHGLQMTFKTNGQKIKSETVIPDHLRGWSNIVHGGVLATICDEVMAWAAIHLTQRFILTRQMTTTFLKPVTIGSKLTATGFIDKRIDERNAVMAGQVFDESGTMCAKSSGDFALFTPQAFKKLGIVPDQFLNQLTGLF